MITQLRASNAKKTQNFYATPMHPLTDTLDELFESVVHDDNYLAFEKIFQRTYRTLCQVSARMVRSRELAEEIVDDVFCSFWANRKRILINSSFQAYLNAAVRNRSLDAIRKMKNENTIDLDSAAEIPSHQIGADESIAYHELSSSIESAIATLPKQCRLIFQMSREQGLMYKEIAELLNISIKTVDTQMGRALKHLRSMVRPSIL